MEVTPPWLLLWGGLHLGVPLLAHAFLLPNRPGCDSEPSCSSSTSKVGLNSECAERGSEEGHWELMQQQELAQVQQVQEQQQAQAQRLEQLVQKLQALGRQAPVYHTPRPRQFVVMKLHGVEPHDLSACGELASRMSVQLAELG